MPMNEIILTPPAGFGPEANIGGTVYVPDPNGMIRTTNIDHAETMQRLHGFVLSGAETVKADPATLGLMQVDELGKTALIEALTARSVTVLDTMGRGELEALAEHWNERRRAGTLQHHGSPSFMETVVRDSFAPPVRAGNTPQNEAPAYTQAVVNQSGQVISGTTAPAKPDFAGMHHKSLEKWLKERGIETAAMDSAGRLKVAEAHWAAHGNQAAGTAEVL